MTTSTIADAEQVGWFEVVVQQHSGPSVAQQLIDADQISGRVSQCLVQDTGCDERGKAGQRRHDRVPARLMATASVGGTRGIGSDDKRSPAAQLHSVHAAKPPPGVASDIGVRARRARHERS
jgi:hypothetical protein